LATRRALFNVKALKCHFYFVPEELNRPKKIFGASGGDIVSRPSGRGGLTLGWGRGIIDRR